MDINYEVLTHPETGFIAFISYLWGNGAIGRFIARLNQYLLFFSFIVTAIVYVNNNRERSAYYILYTFLTLGVFYVISILFIFD